MGPLGAEGGAKGAGAPNLSGARTAATGPLSEPLGAIGGPRFALGAVGTAEFATLGETLYDRFRGPDGAEGGGVCIRGIPEGRAISDRGDAKGGRGDTEGCAGDVLDARGPVGGFNSASLGACDALGDTG